MLAGLVHRLTRDHATVSVVARGAGRLRRVATAAPRPEAVRPLTVDYDDAVAFDRELDAATAAAGRFDTVVAWIRTPSREPVWRRVVPYVADGALLVDVKGSSVVASGAPDPVPGLVGDVPSVRYRRVVLGFVDDGAGGTRWLTDGEISGGVADALRGDAREETIVGRIEPWGDHP
jgi:hypothetical protein